MVQKSNAKGEEVMYVRLPSKRIRELEKRAMKERRTKSALVDIALEKLLAEVPDAR